MRGRWKPGQPGPYAQNVINNSAQRPKGVVRPGGSGAAQAANPAPTAQPLDPQYEAYLNQARYNRQLATGEAAYQTGQIKQDYGIEDQSNPYSRAALLKQSYTQAKTGTGNSLAAGGQLHSGAAGRAQGENDRQYSIGYDQLSRGYQDALHGVQYQQAQTLANYGTGNDDQALQALIRALGGG